MRKYIDGKWFDPRSLSRLCGLIVRVRVVPRRTVVGDIDRRFDNLSGSHHHVNCVSSVYGIYVSGELLRLRYDYGYGTVTVFMSHQRHKYRKLTIHNLHDSDDDFLSGCRNVCQCNQQQSFSGLLSPGRSNHTNKID